MVGRVGKGRALARRAHAFSARAPRPRGHGARDQAHGEVIRCSACAHSPSQTGVDALAAHPTDLAAPHFSLFSVSLVLSSTRYVLLAAPGSLFASSVCHPDEGMAERRQAPGCCEHPVVRAMTGTRAPCFRRPAFPGSGNARLSALHRGDFAARACARRCPAFPPGSCADLIRRTGHCDPEDQVSRASRGGLQIRKPDLGTATGLAPHFKTPLEAPLMSQADPTNKRFANRSQLEKYESYSTS